MFRKDRNRFGGGLLIYTRRGFIIPRVNDLEGKNVESITLLVRSNNLSKGTLIIGAYKPPNMPKNNWESELNTMLLRSFQRYNNIVLLGDLNCDLSQPDNCSKEGRALLDLMDGYNLANVIRQPTRVTSTSSTVIDVILTNKPRSFLVSEVFDLGLSDHHLIYAVMRSHCPRSCPRTVIKRRFRNFDPELFCNDLSMVPFDVAYIFNDVDDISWAWSTLVAGVLDVRAPITRSTVKREHIPYMTPELLDAIGRRNKLKRLYNKSKNSTDRVRYKN